MPISSGSCDIGSIRHGNRANKYYKVIPIGSEQARVPTFGHPSWFTAATGSQTRISSELVRDLTLCVLQHRVGTHRCGTVRLAVEKKAGSPTVHAGRYRFVA